MGLMALVFGRPAALRTLITMMAISCSACMCCVLCAIFGGGLSDDCLASILIGIPTHVEDSIQYSIIPWNHFLGFIPSNHRLGLNSSKSTVPTMTAAGAV